MSDSVSGRTRPFFLGLKVTLRQKMARRVVWLGASLLIGGVSWQLAPIARQAIEPEPVRTHVPLAVSVEKVQQVDRVTITRMLSGQLRPARASELAFEQPGRVLELRGDVGDRVRAGDCLGRVEPRSIQANLRQAQAEWEAVRQTLHEMEAGPRPEQIEAARARVDELEAMASLAQLQHQRREQLRTSDVVALEELDRSRFEQQGAEARLAMAQAQLRELQAGTRSEQIQSQQAKLAQCEARLDALRLDLEHTQLVAPFDGTIAHRHVDPGAVVAVGQPVFRILETSQLEAWVGVPIEMADSLLVGHRVRLQVSGQAVEGTLRRKVPQLNQATRTQTLVFDLPPDSSPSLVPGQLVRVELTQELALRGMWVPSPALVRSVRGLWAVYIVESNGAGQRVARREVEVLHTSGDRSFVRGTLRDGDSIIPTGTHRLVEGQRIQVIQTTVDSK